MYTHEQLPKGALNTRCPPSRRVLVSLLNSLFPCSPPLISYHIMTPINIERVDPFQISAPSLLIKPLAEKCLDHSMFILAFLFRVLHTESKLTCLKVAYTLFYSVLRGICFLRSYNIHIFTPLA